MRRAFQLVALVLLSASALSACGKERWPVKTLQDAGFQASWLSGEPSLRTIGALRLLPKPSKPKERLPVEQSYVYVPAVALGYKLEADGDFHLVIAAQNNAALTMIAEVPDPQCANKRYAPEFAAVRVAIASMGPLRGLGKMTWFPQAIPVTVEGVVFFDKLHGQTGLAPNGVEIHPILKITKTQP